MKIPSEMEVAPRYEQLTVLILLTLLTLLYFQIDCRTQVSKSIFKLTVAGGCPGVFSNSLSHAGVQEYF